jgi:type IV pilus assembly protein PilB
MSDETETGAPDLLLSLLTEHGILTDEQVSEVLATQARTGQTVRSILPSSGMLSEDDLLDIIAGYLGTRVINLSATDIPPEVVHTIPAYVARTYNVVAVDRGVDSVELAIFDVVDPQTVDELTFVLTRTVSFVLAREDDVKTRINEFYGDESASVNEMLASLEAEMEQVDDMIGAVDGEGHDEKDLADAASAAPIIRFVNLVLYQAVHDRASDIHFEPFADAFQIRYRVDGALYEMNPPPRRLALPVISRIKVMSGLNIAERRLPQDGRIQLRVGGRPIDLRVSTLPTQNGMESVVLRVLDRSTVSLDIENLGIPDDTYEQFCEDIDKPNGIIIVTGPTGSGKTTTLYSALARVNTIERKLLTAEEPVEYDVEGIIQVPINPLVGNTFGTILRSFLRQDPDIMMVGEIRDYETAETAVQAALTGHLVFSTLHTTDATGAITRLIDMGVEPFLLSSTLLAVMGQRLIRLVCENCKIAYPPDSDVLNTINRTPEQVGDRVFYHGEGCQECNNTGYKGRKMICEYLRMTDPIRNLVNERKPTLIIRSKAVELGMVPLREDGVRNILNGYTTVEEVVKYT